jgi:hypothetical protein
LRGGCPTEKLKKEIDEMRTMQKDKNISDEVYREYSRELDQRIGEFLMCIEGYNKAYIPWLQHAANLLNVTAVKLQEIWEDAKFEVEMKDPNRKRLTLIPEGA